MSVIPYSGTNENRIILSLPISNSVVLYNSLDNSLEVINNGVDGYRLTSPFPDDSTPQSTDANGENELKCPNCGFHFKVSESNDDPLRRQTSATAAHMDSDYFKLLQRSWQTQESGDNATNMVSFRQAVTHKLIGDSVSVSADINKLSQYVKLSESLFTQGYFDKFFKILEKIGTGSNGSVYKVEHQLNGLNIGVFALKKIGIGEDLNNLANVLKEVKFLYNLTTGDLYDSVVEDINSSVAEPDEAEEYKRDLLMNVDGARHLIKYNHVWLEVDNASTFGPKIPCVFILFEYCGGGDLENFINSKFNNSGLGMTKLDFLKRKKSSTSKPPKREFLNNFEIFKIFKDICFGVYQLHKSHIIHRDLKPSNCLLKQIPSDTFEISSVHDLEKFPDVVVSDFGESTIEGTKRESSGYTGTLEFTSPELLFPTDPNGRSLPNFDKKSDVYSMGLILYFLCFNKLPYRSKSHESVKSEIKEFFDRGDASSFLFPENITEVRPLCDNLTKEGFDENALLSDFTALIERMCSADPEMRPDVDELIVVLVKDLWLKLERFTSVSVADTLRKESVDTITLVPKEEIDAGGSKLSIYWICLSVSLIFILLILNAGFTSWKYIICFALGMLIKPLL